MIRPAVFGRIEARHLFEDPAEVLRVPVAHLLPDGVELQVRADQQLLRLLNAVVPNIGAEGHAGRAVELRAQVLGGHVDLQRHLVERDALRVQLADEVLRAPDHGAVTLGLSHIAREELQQDIPRLFELGPGDGEGDPLQYLLLVERGVALVLDLSGGH